MGKYKIFTLDLEKSSVINCMLVTKNKFSMERKILEQSSSMFDDFEDPDYSIVGSRELSACKENEEMIIKSLKNAKSFGELFVDPELNDHNCEEFVRNLVSKNTKENWLKKFHLELPLETI